MSKPANLVVDPEFERLLIPLSSDERAMLSLGWRTGSSFCRTDTSGPKSCTKLGIAAATESATRRRTT
jgi:hypothetical protein